MSIKNGNRENFEKLVKTGKVLVDFYAVWCGPCKMLSSEIEKISKERKDINIVKINIDDEQTLAMNYGIEAVPTLLVFKDGKLVNKSIGYIEKEKIEKLLD